MCQRTPSFRKKRRRISLEATRQAIWGLSIARNGTGGASPIICLGSYRDVEVRRGHPLADTLGALAREAACERVLLTGLVLKPA